MFRAACSLGKAAVFIGAGFAASFLATQTAGAAEMVTVCRNAAAPSPAAGKVDFQLSRLVTLSTEGVDPVPNDSIALTRDEHGFDLIINWHQKGERSLRAAGADILAMELGGLTHLMVEGSREHVEHYLFTLDEGGSGDLLWNGEASLGQDETSHFTCAKPR